MSIRAEKETESTRDSSEYQKTETDGGHGGLEKEIETTRDKVRIHAVTLHHDQVDHIS